MRWPIAAAWLSLLVFPSVAGAEDTPDPTFNARELENMWRTCAVSGRTTAAKVECVGAQADKMLEEKKVERENRRMEALTRRELSQPDKPGE